MSHIHIPDGVLPLWLILLGWICCLGILYFCVRRVRDIRLEKKLSLVGIVSAIMIVGMTLEIVPIAYHLNMTVIAGIVLGPALGFISVFIVDLIIAMFGHGGITVVGLNTLVVGSEAIIGYYLFRILSNLFSDGGLSIAVLSGVAALLSLILSASLMIGMVYISQVQPGKIIQADKHLHEAVELPTGSTEVQNSKTNIGVFAKTIFLLGSLGWLLEAVITGFVIGYVYKVRPDLISSKIT